MTHSGSVSRGWNASCGWSSETQARINDQIQRVASLAPGSAQHKTATDVLLLLQDSAHVMAEAQGMIRAARLASKHHRATKPI